MRTLIIETAYFLAAVLFIMGLRRMSSPRTARGGIVWAGVGMLLAVLVTLAWPRLMPSNLLLILIALGLGTALAWWSGQRVAMTAMPQMVALYNGMGGGAAAAIGLVELAKQAQEAAVGSVSHVELLAQGLALLGALIGAVSFSGSLIAFAKLQGWMQRSLLFPGQRLFNALVLLTALGMAGLLLLGTPTVPAILVFVVLALAFGVLMTLPIGGADMPVVISLYNAFTGLAVAFEGYGLKNGTMIIAGTVVGAAGTLLTQLMAKAMNRSLTNVLVGGFGAVAEGGGAIEGSMKPVEANDAASMMAYAERVTIVPGYGMAVAQAQHKLWEFAKALIAHGVKLRFAIHPVAGRMPGHMNVLLAEAGVPYDLIVDMEEINPEFPLTDVALVIGANDVVNPRAKTDPSASIYGMPILDVASARQVIVIKRGQGTGFAGLENALFYTDNTRMLYGDAQAAMSSLLGALKALDG